MAANGAEIVESTVASAFTSDMFKTWRCKAIVMEEVCQYGEACICAHTPQELRPPPESLSKPVAAHWQGKVSIGVVEHALFWDLPPVGVTDVVCNRTTCLGNPFGGREYGPSEERPPADDQGWVLEEHANLCDAFGEYLAAVLDRNADPEENLVLVAERVSVGHSVFLSQTWEAQRLRRDDVLRALDELGRRVAAGQCLRLLCHCRPHVRCHAELLKTYLGQHTLPASSDESGPTQRQPVPEDGNVDCHGCSWPGFGTPGPRCAGASSSWQCHREGRALDPGTLELYCAQCWSRHCIGAKWSAKAEWNRKKAARGDEA